MRCQMSPLMQDIDVCSQYGFEENSQYPQKDLIYPYTLEEIEQFLDNTFGKHVNVNVFFLLM